MNNEFAKYLQLGAHLESLYTGEVFNFKGLGDNPELLLAYKGSDYGNIIELRVDGVKAIDIIRFVTPDYVKLFEVTNLDNVVFDGEMVRAVWYDECHFAFARNKSLGLVWHISEFAEKINASGDRVKVISRA